MLIISGLLLFLFFQSPFLYSQDKEYNIASYGAKGDGLTMATKAIQSAIEDCHKNGGGTVVIPSGEFISAPIYLKGNINLYLAPGAVLKGSGNLDDYSLELDGMIGDQKNTLINIINTGEETISGESDRAGLITAYNTNNISITGEGIIDGNAMAYHDETKMHWGGDREANTFKSTRQGKDYVNPEYNVHGPLAHGERPGNLVRLINCEGVRVQDITFQNSPTWTFQVNTCKNVTISGIRINSFASDLKIPNDDGINIQASTLVRISDSDIHTGDDSIAVFDVTKLAVTNCSLSSRSAAVRIGDTGMGRVTQDCIFKNIIIHTSNRALGVFLRRAGSISNVLFSDIIIKNELFTGHWWGQGEPIHVSALPYDENGTIEQFGTISNVRFKNIIAESQHGVVVHGCPESSIENLSFDNITLLIKNSPINEQFGGNFDFRYTTRIDPALFAHDIPAIFTRYTNGLELKNITVKWAKDLPDFFTSAIHCEEFNYLTIDGFKGIANHPTLHPTLSLVNGMGLTVKNSKALKGTIHFLEHRNIKDYLLFSGNDLLNAKNALSPPSSNFTMFGNILSE
jgi:polygalacturonase